MRRCKSASRGVVAGVVAPFVVVLSSLLGGPAPPVAAAPAGAEAVVGFVVRGVGNGHGRGLSQWGSYGRALDGQSWTEILDDYYQGTSMGDRSGARVRVWLTALNNTGTAGVTSTSAAVWNGHSYRSLYAAWNGTSFTVYGSAEQACPGGLSITVPHQQLQQGASGPGVSELQRLLNHLGADPQLTVDGQFGVLTAQAVAQFQAANGLAQTGAWREQDWVKADELVGTPGATAWTLLQSGVAGPIRFTTPADESSASHGDVLGACQPDGSVIHYRGAVEFAGTADGTRVINDVSVENYLRGVVPRESPAYWGDGGGGIGINALQAQSVAARSYGLSENRKSYAGTCDTSSCQVYGGAASRITPTSGVRRLEDPRTDQAIAATAGKVRVWPDGRLVRTEFSASNGPRTAGGEFPAVDDPWDDHPDNPNHSWTRVISADRMAEQYGLSRADAVHTATAAGSKFDGIWANQVVLGNGSTRSAWDFRNDFGLPAPGFELIPIVRGAAQAGGLAFIGDSVGTGIAGEPTSPLQVLLDGVYPSTWFNSRVSRPTGGGADDGAAVAAAVPAGTTTAVVELGYNDTPSQMPARIDKVMAALRARGVTSVRWVTVSERSTSHSYALTNAAIRAATERWPELSVLDWQAASSAPGAGRWFNKDGIHLTSTGNAELSVWLRDQLAGPAPRAVSAGQTYQVPVLGAGGVPASGVAGVALNVTAVGPAGPGYLRAWDCATPKPDTSSVNWTQAGAVAPNAVLVPLAAGSGSVCFEPLVNTHVLVDVAGYFPVDEQTGEGVVRPAAGRLTDTRETGGRLPADGVLRVPVLGAAGVPADGVAGLALNVTAVNPSAPGFLRVWDCAAAEPDTSSVNWTQAGAVAPNAVIVPLAAGAGEVCVRALVATDVIVDVAGWFAGGARSAVGRAADTRATGERLGPDGVLRVPVLGRAGVPETGVAGVALNVTAVNTAAPGFLRVWDCAAPEPDTSSVNYVSAGSVAPNAVIVPFATGSTGEVCVRTLAGSDVLVDVAGWFEAGIAAAAGRIADTRIALGPVP